MENFSSCMWSVGKPLEDANLVADAPFLCSGMDRVLDLGVICALTTSHEVQSRSQVASCWLPTGRIQDATWSAFGTSEHWNPAPFLCAQVSAHWQHRHGLLSAPASMDSMPDRCWNCCDVQAVPCSAVCFVRGSTSTLFCPQWQEYEALGHVCLRCSIVDASSSSTWIIDVMLETIFLTWWFPRLGQPFPVPTGCGLKVKCWKLGAVFSQVSSTCYLKIYDIIVCKSSCQLS